MKVVHLNSSLWHFKTSIQIPQTLSQTVHPIDLWLGACVLSGHGKSSAEFGAILTSNMININTNVISRQPVLCNTRCVCEYKIFIVHKPGRMNATFCNFTLRNRQWIRNSVDNGQHAIITKKWPYIVELLQKNSLMTRNNSEAAAEPRPKQEKRQV